MKKLLGIVVLGLQNSYNILLIAKEEYNLDITYSPYSLRQLVCMITNTKPVAVSAGFNATCYYEI